MLVKGADVDLPILIDFVGHAEAGQNVEGEILSLRTAHVGVTVDPTETEAARNVGNQSPIRTNKIVTAAEVDAEIMIFDSADNRFGHQGETKLIVTARPAVAVVHAPPNAAGDELRSNFVTIGISENAEQISGFNCDFESRRN